MAPFQKMRGYLRRTADRICVIDCSPEGHQPDVPTRIFQVVQQPVCIVLAARSKRKTAEKPAVVKYTVLPAGKREQKFAALAQLKLDSRIWQNCATDWRAPFLPEAKGDWARYLLHSRPPVIRTTSRRKDLLECRELRELASDTGASSAQASMILTRYTARTPALIGRVWRDETGFGIRVPHHRVGSLVRLADATHRHDQGIAVRVAIPSLS